MFKDVCNIQNIILTPPPSSKKDAEFSGKSSSNLDENILMRCLLIFDY